MEEEKHYWIKYSGISSLRYGALVVFEKADSDYEAFKTPEKINYRHLLRNSSNIYISNELYEFTRDSGVYSLRRTCCLLSPSMTENRKYMYKDIYNNLFSCLGVSINALLRHT